MLAVFLILLKTTALSGGVAALDLRECNRALGMESKRILDDHITASSSFDHLSTGPQNARIRTETGGGAWCPKQQINSESSEWLQISLSGDTVISAIETQGRYGNGHGVEYAAGYMLEYWRKSLGIWARYKDANGNEIINGNTNTRTAVLRILDGGFVAEKIRIIPVSDQTRTVCMRVELYGCPFKDTLVSYSIRDGSVADGLDMRDQSYDGKLDDSGNLVGGLGKLYDGALAEDNFDVRPHKWVGWRRENIGSSLNLIFDFSETRNISAVSLHTCNQLNHGAEVFQRARIFFSATNQKYSDRFVDFRYVPDKMFENARWVRIPVPDRLAKRVRIELFLANEWLLISEVKFETGNIQFNFLSEEVETTEMEVDESINGNTVAYFAINDGQSDFGRHFVIGLVLALFVCFGTLLVFGLVCCCRRRLPNKNASVFADRRGNQVRLILDGHSATTIKKQSPSTYRMKADNMENSLLEKLPVLISNDSSSEYAEPDCNSPSTEIYGGALIPLLPSSSSPCRSSDISGGGHYAARDVTMLYNTATLPKRSPNASPPLSASIRYGCFANQAMSTFSTATGGQKPIEIDRTALQFRERIGQGEFGEVHLCQLEHRLVAVKMLRSDADANAEADFQHEMNILGRLRHPNVVEVIGICTRQRPMAAIVEYMPQGDLVQHLQQRSTLSSEFLLGIVTQVAAGMAYLESERFVHRDLAARNCLVDNDGTVKISDFGMARSLYSTDYYRIEGAFLLPIRWMAWECLLLGKFTSKSDVWAFAVTMWEIMSGCREKPFAQFTDPQVVDNLQFMYHNRRLQTYLSRPVYCSSSLYADLMLPCWSYEDDVRPTLQALHRRLQQFCCSAQNTIARCDFV